MDRVTKRFGRLGRTTPLCIQVRLQRYHTACQVVPSFPLALLYGNVGTGKRLPLNKPQGRGSVRVYAAQQERVDTSRSKVCATILIASDIVG